MLEVAEHNRCALTFYCKRNFYKLDAAIFMAEKVEQAPELLPPRPLKTPRQEQEETDPPPGASDMWSSCLDPGGPCACRRPATDRHPCIPARRVS